MPNPDISIKTDMFFPLQPTQIANSHYEVQRNFETCLSHVSGIIYSRCDSRCKISSYNVGYPFFFFILNFKCNKVLQKTSLLPLLTWAITLIPSFLKVPVELQIPSIESWIYLCSFTRVGESWRWHHEQEERFLATITTHPISATLFPT